MIPHRKEQRSMRIGSLVEAQHSFDDVREQWGFNYPYKGDILTVSGMMKHPKCEGLVLLFFEEIDMPHGISDKTITDQPNFLEVMPPMEIDLKEIISNDGAKKGNRIQEFAGTEG